MVEDGIMKFSLYGIHIPLVFAC